MFDNVGGKIKGLALVTFALSFFGSFVGAILLMDSSAGLGLLVMVVGFLTSLMGAWFLYAFGELVEKTAENEANTRKILEILKAQQQEKTAQSRPQPQPYYAPVPQNRIPQSQQPVRENTAPQAPVSAVIADGQKFCPKCGTAQRADRHVCWSCGQKFDN